MNKQPRDGKSIRSKNAHVLQRQGRSGRRVLQSDPFLRTPVCIYQLEKTAIKILCYDSQGFWQCQKRLYKGRFDWWPKKEASFCRRLEAHELQMLLWNGDPFHTRATPAWRKLPT